MSDAVKQFSFLNRWYIFKRTSQGLADEALAMGEQAPVVGEEESPDEQKAELAAAAAAVRTAAAVDGTMMPSIIGPGSLAAAEAARTAGLPKAEEVPEAGPAGVAAAAAPGTKLTVAPTNKKYLANEIIRFSEKSAEKEPKLKLPTKYAAFALRHLCPSAQFPIRDTTDTTDTNLYPSIIHFLAGMMIKYGNPSKKDLAWTLFGNTGSIHQMFETRRKVSKLTPVENYNLMAEEAVEVGRELATLLGRANSSVDLTLWNVKKEEMLTIAVQQRMQRDEWFKQIVDAATGKYLLYENATSSLGGRFTSARKVEGENAYGKKIMELAGYSV